MNPESEAQQKLERVDKQKSQRMEIEEPSVVRAQFLMSRFNINEAKRSQRSRQAMWFSIGLAILLTVIAMGIILICGG